MYSIVKYSNQCLKKKIKLIIQKIFLDKIKFSLILEFFINLRSGLTINANDRYRNASFQYILNSKLASQAFSIKKLLFRKNVGTTNKDK
ncbi:hypothetical protein HOF65_03715 [bacterium]|nr:hypothetical protein [bacterium]MBT3853084.1 hypothetical protein [bacterium]MBT4633558.1 hypothetical protein [bacterium]MBT5490916.1 hypothetical protein [bacterium]MBT6778606.1 hypothetical protein [bacterium]